MEELARMIQGLKDSFLSMLGMDQAQAEESGIAGFFDFLIGLFTGQTQTDVETETPDEPTMIQRLGDGARLFNNFRTTADAGRTWEALQEAHRAQGGGAVEHINPVDASVRVSSDHGHRERVRLTNGGWSSENHRGVDLAGGGNIVSSADGVVLFVDRRDSDRGYGNCVIIGHADGTYSFYGHMANIDPDIQVGGAIGQNDRIGVMGATGDASGVHLHYEQRRGSESLIPRIAGRTFGDNTEGQTLADNGVVGDGTEYTDATRVLENSLPAALVAAMRAAGITASRE